jgi:hypothetical protein
MTDHYERPVLGSLVQWIDVAPHPTRGTIYGVVEEVCTFCCKATVKWNPGVREQIPLERFGEDRPDAWVRVVKRKPTSGAEFAEFLHG